MNRSFRGAERGQMGSLRDRDNNKDEDLELFREMRNREKERNNLLQNSDEFDTPLGQLTGNVSMYVPTATSAPIRKTSVDEFLNSDNDKSDYDWLLTPPGTPLFPSLEMESHKTVMSQQGSPKARPTALKSRLANPQLEAAARSNMTYRQPTSSPGLNTSSGGLRRPSSSGGPGSRPGSSTGRPTLSSTSRSNLTSASKTSNSTLASNRSTLTSVARPTLTTSSKITSTTLIKPSRSSTPTRASFPSSKPTVPPRSSTPTTRSTTRSSTPTQRASIPASKPTSRAATPTRRPTTVSSATSTSSLIAKSVSTAVKNPLQPRSSSPSVRPKPWNPSDMPGFSLEVPPNLRTSLPDRPPSATRGRPGAPSSRSSSVEPASNGRIRRQSCSPSRGRPPNGISHSSGSSVPVPAVNRLYAKANDKMSPALIGAKMVDRVMNMRKLVPPSHDDKHSPRSNLSGKSSSSPDSSGFGRNLSKKSLDMAIRHMDLRRTIQGNNRRIMTNIPASSMYSVRSGPTRSRAASVSDSPLATSSNASSDFSVNNNALCVDGPEFDDDVSSHRGIRSPASLRGR